MEIRGKRFLITAGAGLMGSHIADRLLGGGASEVVLLDNFVRGSMHNLEETLKDSRVKLVKGDIRDLSLFMDKAYAVGDFEAIWTVEGLGHVYSRHYKYRL